MNENQFNQNNTQFENQPMGNGFYGDSGVENVKGRSKGKKAAIIGGISAAVIVGGGAAAYNCSDFVKNQVKLRTMKPENYYAWVYENNAEEFGKSVSESYSKALDLYKNGTSASYELRYNLSDSVKDLAKESFLTGTDEDAEIEKFFDNTNSVSIKADTKTKDGVTEVGLGLGYNEDTLFSVEAAGDITANDYFLRIPELKDQWISLSLGSALDELAASEVMSAYADLVKDPASFLSPEELEKEITDYTSIWCDLTKDVTVEKKEEVQIADITVEYTAATVTVDEKLALELVVKMAENLKDDEIAKNIIVNKLGVIDEEEYTSSLTEMLDELKAELDEGDFDTETLDFTTYIDAKGVIRGINITNDSEDDIFAALGKDDKNIRGELRIGEGEYSTSATFVADETAKDTYDGSLDLTVEGETASLTFTSLEIVDNEKGYMNGSVSVQIPDESPVTVKLSTDGKAQTITYDINVDGEDYGSADLIYSTDFSADASLPDKSGAFAIDIENAESVDIKEYLTEDDIKTFVTTLMDKLGFANEDIKKDIDEAVSEIYKEMDGDIFASKSREPEHNWDDEDFDFDDEEFDWDDEDFDFDDKDFDFDFDIEETEKADDNKKSASGQWETDLDPDEFEITTDAEGNMSIKSKN